jgi:hypothetical protein
MEKIIIFLPIVIFFGVFALLAGGFLLLVFKLVMKSKNSSWTGEVIVVMTDLGKEMKVGLSGPMWEQFNKGDKIKKEKGKLFPEKI